MDYTMNDYYLDNNKILYSPYYRALAGKQHGNGTITASDYLRFKEMVARRVYKSIGGGLFEYVKVLLQLKSLADAPYGFGGANVFKEQFGYDKDAQTLKIAKELGLSKAIIAELSTQEIISAEGGVVYVVELLSKNIITFSEALAKDIAADISANSDPNHIRCSDKLYDALKEMPQDEALLATIAQQEDAMKKLIARAQEQGVQGDILSFLLSIREPDGV